MENIEEKVTSLRNLTAKLGTKQDNERLHQQIYELRLEIQDQVMDTRDKINELPIAKRFANIFYFEVPS